MDQDVVSIMEQSISANKYICDSYKSSLELYRKIIRLIVAAFVLCILLLIAMNMYNTYLSYDYEDYPISDVINTNTNTNTNMNN